MAAIEGRDLRMLQDYCKQNRVDDSLALVSSLRLVFLRFSERWPPFVLSCLSLPESCFSYSTYCLC
jgi:hypothetical protein